MPLARLHRMDRLCRLSMKERARHIRRDTSRRSCFSCPIHRRSFPGSSATARDPGPEPRQCCEIQEDECVAQRQQSYLPHRGEYRAQCCAEVKGELQGKQRVERRSQGGNSERQQQGKGDEETQDLVRNELYPDAVLHRIERTRDEV